MAKITIDDITGQFTSVQAINDRLQQVEDELNGKVLYRDNPTGEPNNMSNDLDMSNNSILNLPAPTDPASPVRLKDVGGIIDIGDKAVIIPTQEEKVLSDGQTSVTFTEYSTQGATFYLSGPSVDIGRLNAGDDYTFSGDQTIILANSYPAGTKVILGRVQAGGVTKPEVTGSKGGNVALASLISALVSLDLITDNTT